MGFHVKPYAVYYTIQLPLSVIEHKSFVVKRTGVSYVDMFEQKVARYWIDRLRSKRALDKLDKISTINASVTGAIAPHLGDKDLSDWLGLTPASHSISLNIHLHTMQGNLVFFHRNSIKLYGSFWTSRGYEPYPGHSLEGNPAITVFFRVVHAHKECCYYIGTDSLPDGRPATQVTSIDSTIYVPLRNWRSNSPLTYVLGAIIMFVWFKRRPMRKRLPSRWKPMESKES
ncbi:unnamed protein product [Peronospora destructor]|uniref:Uncharacterized protein n=1 Tax=Peronospora destructor TaxID=86335 RepID=A0AAV0VC25_9STRA|nr:unnamed protein product [Peronospora destructor]